MLGSAKHYNNVMRENVVKFKLLFEIVQDLSYLSCICFLVFVILILNGRLGVMLYKLMRIHDNCVDSKVIC